MKNIKKVRRTPEIIGLIIVIFLFVIMMLPLFWMFSCSLKLNTDIFKTPPVIFPRHPTLDPYITQLFNESFSILASLKNSMIIAVATTVIATVLSIPAAYGVARFNFKFKRAIIFIFLVTQMLPSVFTLIPNFIIFKKIGVYNTYWAPILADCTLGIPFCVLMLRPYFISIPKEIEDAARIDGCGALRVFLQIVTPIVSTGIVVAVVFSFLFGYGDMVNALTFINEQSLWPVTTGIYNCVGRYGIRWNEAMAFGVMAVIPVVAIFLLMQKYVVAGLIGGAVKG
ncbi:MAG TPA: carbohydrate ABC transporter permease [Clostridia bacterium]|nr:carbohydrate ABC transporter permease [Clostridia bacterium]